MSGNGNSRLYTVVMNSEDQYSIWWDDKQLPLGWKRVGFTGPKHECLQHIERTWTDMLPKSVRQRLNRLPTSRTS